MTQAEESSRGGERRSKRAWLLGELEAVWQFSRSLFWALLFAFTIRAFVVEPFKIPSRSMVPTLLVGDHIFVNKFAYGLRIPWTKTWLWEREGPRRGDVVVFINPRDESLDFIKRVVGLPGDAVSYDGETFSVNGKPLSTRYYEVLGIDPEDSRHLRATAPLQTPDFLQDVPYATHYDLFALGIEDLDRREHFVQYFKAAQARRPFTILVPEGHFFVMGDNRDESADSREWGFVPQVNLKGEALFVWLSIDKDQGGVRWHRFGRGVR